MYKQPRRTNHSMAQRQVDLINERQRCQKAMIIIISIAAGILIIALIMLGTVLWEFYKSFGVKSL